ncbi:MAG: hypothetical protein WCW64_00780 [Phycisphaerae bacterium]|jgi:hypothetical protein
MTKKIGVAYWLIVLSVVLFILFALSAFVSDYEGVPNKDTYYFMNIGVSSIIAAIIVFGSAITCARWAQKINNNLNIAYAIGFLTNVIGLLGYWIYYKNKTKKYA